MTRSLTRVSSISSLKPRQSAIRAVGRIPQDGIAAADQHGDISHADLKAIEQVLGLAVAIEIDVLKRMAIPGQELLHPQRPGAMRGADHDDVAQMARNQLEAAQDERAHDDLAELSVGLNQRQHLFAIELNHVARLADPQTGERATTADHVGFA